MPTRRHRARQVPSRRAPRPAVVALAAMVLTGLSAPAAAATGPGSGAGSSTGGSSGTTITTVPTTTTVPTGSRAVPAVARPTSQEQAEASAASLRRDRDAIRAEVASLQQQRREQYDRWALNQLALQAAQREMDAARQRSEQARLDALAARDQLTAYAAEAFMSPPASESLAVLSIADADTASRAHDLLSIVADEQHGVVGDFLVAEQTEQRRAQQAEIEVVEHSSREAVHAAELTRLDGLIDQQQQLDSQIDERLDTALAEAAALEEVDRKAAKELATQERALASESKAAATGTAAPAPGRTTDKPAKPVAAPTAGTAPTTTVPTSNATSTTTTTTVAEPVAPSAPPGNLVTWQDVTKVGGIWVHRSIAPRVEALLAAAASSGIRLSGGGFRDPSEQIRLRRAHCGPTDYDVYERPASQCSPPTAQPGRSMHERGLAIDFTVGGAAISSRSSPAFQWLAANAASYGFYNLPSEPWHWSTNGS